jgi:hypothetical protein
LKEVQSDSPLEKAKVILCSPLATAGFSFDEQHTSGLVLLKRSALVDQTSLQVSYSASSSSPPQSYSKSASGNSERIMCTYSLILSVIFTIFAIYARLTASLGLGKKQPLQKKIDGLVWHGTEIQTHI